MKNPAAAITLRRLRQFALCSTALSAGLLVGSVALAAPPTAGSLPGNFTSVGSSTTTSSYTLSGTSNTKATIAITPGGTAPSGIALDFNGAGTTKLAPASGTSLPAGVTQNSGFSIGSGATLTITGAGSLPLLINDTTGNPSQIFGSVDNSADSGAMFVANANGVVVGSTGSITTGASLGLLGFAQSGSTFASNGSISVDSSTAGTGGVTVDSGATLSPTGAPAAPVLVASNGAINIGASTAAGYTLISGYGVSGGGSSGTVLPSGASASITFTGGSKAAPIEVTALSAAGSVTNSGVTDFTNGVGAAPGSGAYAPTIDGAFSNTGVAYVGNTFTAGSINNAGQLNDAGGTLKAVGLSGATSGADITNTGVINESTGSLTLNAGDTTAAGAATGNFSNSGVIAFTTAAPTGTNALTVDAANINFAGSVMQTATGASAPTALSATNALVDFSLDASYLPKTGPVVPGVVDFGSTIYSPFDVSGQAVRILSGGLNAPNGTPGGTITVGTGTATDPFSNNAKLAYNLSVFPKAMVEGNSVTLDESAASVASAGSNMNLDGTVSTQVSGATPGSGTISVTANNINGNATGGFAVNDGDRVDLTFTGNVNNPYGASAAGSSDFRYNYVPVAVANAAAGGTGTVNLVLNGPTNSTTTAQNVNILVGGNVAVTNPTGATTTLPTTTTPITPAASYVNNHLVLQATGNIDNGTYSAGTGKVAAIAPFYWPGLLYLNTVSSMSNPTQLSSSGEINLNSDLSNILPALSTGGTGIFFETNNLNLNGNTVTTSNDSWVNFATTKIASAFALTQSSQFFGGYKDTVTPTVTELGVQQLPAGDFQPQ